MAGCCANGMPLCAVADGCALMKSFAAAAGAPVAWKVALDTPADDATSVCGPARVPSVHEVSVATPDTLVVTGVEVAAGVLQRDLDRRRERAPRRAHRRRPRLEDRLAHQPDERGRLEGDRLSADARRRRRSTCRAAQLHRIRRETRLVGGARRAHR